MSVDMSKHFSTSALIRFTLPTIAMMIFTSCYTIVDGFFVSNYAGKTALAAVNLIFPAVMIFGLRGHDDRHRRQRPCGQDWARATARARRHFSLLIIFAFVVGSVLSLGGWFFMEPTATMLGATPGSQMHHDAALRPHDDDLAAVLHLAVRLPELLSSRRASPSTAFWSLWRPAWRTSCWTSCSSACSAGASRCGARHQHR